MVSCFSSNSSSADQGTMHRRVQLHSVNLFYCLGPLGAWVEKQRIEYKKYKALHEDDPAEAAAGAASGDEKPRTTLTKERVQKLNDIGFVYDVVSSLLKCSTN